MRYLRAPIEIESPEEVGYGTIRYNLAESSVTDAKLGELPSGLADLALAYSDHRGKPELRELIAASDAALRADDVLLTMGAAGALFMVATSLLDRDSHAVVAFPNYSTNIETPRAIGCRVDLLELRFEEGYRLDPDRFAALMMPETRLVSLTAPHNPTGSLIDEADLRTVVALVEERGAYLLLDETYREMTFGPTLPLAATLSPRVISVSSVSKSFGLPGLRIGWLICRDRELMETLLAAKEQIHICNPVITEEITHAFLLDRDVRFAEIRRQIEQKFELTRRFMARESRLAWVEPKGGVVGFPRIKADVAVDVDRFYDVLGSTFGTAVGPGHWFEVDRRHMRIGFGYPDVAELQGGLEAITSALDEAS